MTSNRKDQLRALLREVEPTAPRAEFTDEVMRSIAFLKEDHIPADNRLKEVLQQAALPEPPSNFTYKVLLGIEQPKQVIAKPVIARGVWIGICLFVATCVVVALTYPAQNTTSDTYLNFSWIGDYTIRWTSPVQDALLHFEVIVLSAGTLLGLERLLRRGTKISKHIHL